MKVLSIAIPSYNSESYMEHCINSLLPGGEDVEILIVDDGSKDNTAAIADEYERRYPGIIRAIHQENGGHGEAVNAGLRHATGYFFKVVDSDDWVDQDAYAEVLGFLKEAIDEEEPLDMLISNYVYEKQGARHKKVIHYRKILPENRYFGWDEVGSFRQTQNILMHSVIYRTKMLRSCGFILPKHTFYVDNVFVYWPLPHVKKMYYLNVDFYRYFIGRDDQSVNEKVMIKRIDQQLRVNKIMIDLYKRYEPEITSQRLDDYMLHYLETITIVSATLLVKMKTKKADMLRDQLWEYMKKQSPKAYDAISKTFYGRMLSSHKVTLRYVTIGAYKVAQKWLGFN